MNFLRRFSSQDIPILTSPARWLAVVGTVFIPLLTICFLGSNNWSTIATAIGTLFGLYGVWLTLEIFMVGERISNQQGRLISEVHHSVMAGLKTHHIADLRRKYFDAKDAGDKGIQEFWHFVWRFETYNEMTIGLTPKGAARIRVVGTSESPLSTDLESIRNPIYTVEILEVRDCPELMPGRAYAMWVNGKTLIGNDASDFNFEGPSFEFSIGGLGPIRAGATDRRPRNFTRLKDLKAPTEEGDRG